MKGYLDKDGEGLAVGSDVDLRLKRIVLVEGNLIPLWDNDRVFLFGG